MATLETSLEANSDRQTDRMTEKATYRGSSYRSAQKGGDDFFMDFSQMGNLLGGYETNYKVKKIKNLLLGKIWPPSDLLFLE